MAGLKIVSIASALPPCLYCLDIHQGMFGSTKVVPCHQFYLLFSLTDSTHSGRILDASGLMDCLGKEAVEPQDEAFDLKSIFFPTLTCGWTKKTDLSSHHVGRRKKRQISGCINLHPKIEGENHQQIDAASAMLSLNANWIIQNCCGVKKAAPDGETLPSLSDRPFWPSQTVLVLLCRVESQCLK